MRSLAGSQLEPCISCFEIAPFMCRKCLFNTPQPLASRWACRGHGCSSTISDHLAHWWTSGFGGAHCTRLSHWANKCDNSQTPNTTDWDTCWTLLTSHCWWYRGACGWRGRPASGSWSSSFPPPATVQRWIPSLPCSGACRPTHPPALSHTDPYTAGSSQEPFYDERSL